MKLKPIILILICGFCMACQNTSTSYIADEIVEKRLNQLIEENNIPGINFSIIYGDGMQKNYSAGYADMEAKHKLNPQHVIFSGSIGKTYAVAILMQLMEEGKFNLKDKLIDHFPEVDWLKRLPNISDITIEMLLQHTSGLPRYINNQALWDTLKANPDKVWTYEERMAFVFDSEPLHKPGESWAYSDTNYLLLGMLIEKLCESKYYDEVKNRILEVQNLKTTFPANKRTISGLPQGYSKLEAFFRMPHLMVTEGKYAFNPQMEWTGGGIASSTSDLAKWAKIYFTPTLFKQESLQNIITVSSNGKNIAENTDCGMGSFTYHTQLGKAYGHTGFVPGFVSIFAYFPDKDMAVAMQINCDYAKKKMSLSQYLEKILMTKNTVK